MSKRWHFKCGKTDHHKKIDEGLHAKRINERAFLEQEAIIDAGYFRSLLGLTIHKSYLPLSSGVNVEGVESAVTL